MNMDNKNTNIEGEKFIMVNFFDLKHQIKHKKANMFFKNVLIMILIMLICTGISLIFKDVKMPDSNIVMIYLLGILIFSYLAEDYIYSFFACMCGVLLYNLFFTEPYYTFRSYNPDYIITFLVMFIISLTTSMLTIRVKIGRQLIADREEYISCLYHIERRLLNVKSGEDLAKISSEEISKQFNANVLVEFSNSAGILLYKNICGEDVFDGEIDCSARLKAYESQGSCGRGTNLFTNAKAYYSPILGQNRTAGVIGISAKDTFTLSNAQRAFIDAAAPQIAAVLEREKNYKKRKETQVEMQKERLRADMLSSISHDLRTPLAGIMGLASTSLDNYDKLSDEVKKSFLKSIYEDADWLNELVENVLQTTRLAQGKVKLNIQEEAAEEIITEAVTHVKKHAPNHKISVKIPDEIILVQVDGILIRQVIINILNNAVNYSPEKSDIIVSLYREGNRVVFEVKDSGPGISKEEMLHLFERYYHKSTKKIGSKKGMGLGLALCKSIIEAHNGQISIKNNKPHGTIVSFYVLSEKERI